MFALVVAWISNFFTARAISQQDRSRVGPLPQRRWTDCADRSVRRIHVGQCNRRLQSQTATAADRAACQRPRVSASRGELLEVVRQLVLGGVHPSRQFRGRQKGGLTVRLAPADLDALPSRLLALETGRHHHHLPNAPSPSGATSSPAIS